MRLRLSAAVAATSAVCLLAPLGSTVVQAADAPTSPQQGQDQPSVTELIVKYKPGVAPTEAPGVATGDSAVAGVDLEPGRNMSLGLRTVELSESFSVAEAEEIATELQKDPRVLSAAPNRRVFPASATMPNDPHYADSGQWGLNGIYGIDGPSAWNLTTGSASVVVAVIDTGILPHSDLPGSSQVPGYDMISNAAWANDGSGRDPNPTDPGDWVTPDESANPASPYFGCGPRPSSWHGTHVTGTINAKSDNGVGVASVAPGVRVQPVRVLGKCGGSASDIIDAITWASGGSAPAAPPNTTPAEVINMSLGGGGACDGFIQSAINAAVARGTTVVVAAGNEDADASTTYPASCNNVVTVAATNSSGKRTPFSNYGPKVDLAAPGYGILSTLNEGMTTATAESYEVYNGTSMAAPHVAGLAALVKSRMPGLTPAQVEARLKTYVRPFLGGECEIARTCGTGIANAGAVTGVVLPIPGSVSAPSRVRYLKATYRKAKAYLTWSRPASSGGAAMLGYRYRVSKNNGSSWSAWRFTSAVKASLTRKRNRPHLVQVAAVNAKRQGTAVRIKLRRF